MLTASNRIRSERARHNSKAIVLIAAALVFANLTVLFGLSATAQAGDFPDALRYAPMTWEKKIPVPAEMPETADAVQTAEITAVGRANLDPVTTGTTPRRFSEVATTDFAATAGTHHRSMLIVFMSIALAAMAGVSVAMFRSLAREVSEAERRRKRF